MINENTLYFITNPPHHNPNLLVEDVLSSIDLPLLEEPFIAINNTSNFAAEVQRKLEKNPKNRKTYILIVPPNKSSLILQDKENISLVDSHSQKSKGALIIVGRTSYPMQFCQFIEAIITRDWKTTLEFANLSQLKLVIT